MNKISQNKAFLMVISILSAILLWLYVDNLKERQIPSQYITVPVEFLGESDVLAQRGLMVTAGQDVSLRFRLRGLREQISDINTKRDQFRVQVDLRGINTVGQHTLDYVIIYPDTVSETDYIVEDASLRTVTVTISAMSQREVPIRCELVGEVPDGYMVDTPRLQPETLTVRGLQADVSLVDHAVVVVDMNGAAADVSLEAEFTLVDRTGAELEKDRYRINAAAVQVTVPVLIIKELPLDVNLVESPGSTRAHMPYSIRPNRVVVAGDAMSLSNLESLVLGTINLSEITEDTTLEMNIPLPANSRLLEGDGTAEVTIGCVGLETRAISTTDISFINPPSGPRVSVVTREIEVVLRGPAEELEALSDFNVRLVADLTDVSTTNGNYAVPAAVYVDGARNVGAIGQYQVVVRISR